ncbi:Immunoglobulin-like fold [Ostreococcus tauri]|uniref:Immunoglobulin-like fold n=1 Tax=Ostreococcus tauri TaxID=70448 RepID=A0A090M0V4_OSTTA|nr:Immunoglobulin-like fold [Ostreococcus tauri]CEF97811.1 Immunoglobulin-like fold [Ostreococcus tauri]|eukprot:XP_022838899.1 Immunoglobulin-like fold [Ostreococcus tauri]
MSSTRGGTRRGRTRGRARGWAVAACALARATTVEAYARARDVGYTAAGAPMAVDVRGGTGLIDVYGLNFAPGTSAAVNATGELKCVFGGSPGWLTEATAVNDATVRCDAPTADEGFVALGLSSNAGVDAILFHELGMSSVVNFVKEFGGVLTRATPRVASQGDVAMLTGRNAVPRDGRADIVGSARECEWRGTSTGSSFEVSYVGMGVHVSSALVACEIPPFAAYGSVAEERAMYSVSADSRVALIERVNLASLAISSLETRAISEDGGVALDIAVAGSLGSMFLDDGAPYVRFGSISVAGSATSAYVVTAIAPAMAPSASTNVWVAGLPSMNSGRSADGVAVEAVGEYYGVVSRVESGVLPVNYSWSVDPLPTGFSRNITCVTMGVGETSTSANGVCASMNQLAGGFVTVMMSYNGRELPLSRPYDSQVVAKVTAMPAPTGVTPARGPAEGGAVTWVSGTNLHETVRSTDSWAPRCSFGVDTSGSSLGVVVSSALIACETPHVGTSSSSTQVVVAGSSGAAQNDGPKYAFMANTLVYQHSIVPHLGPTYGGTRVVFTLGNGVAATSMTSCRFGTIVVNGWTPLVSTDADADAGIVCVAPAMPAGAYKLGLGTVRGSVGDSTTSDVTLGTTPYDVYSEYV